MNSTITSSYHIFKLYLYNFTRGTGSRPVRKIAHGSMTVDENFSKKFFERPNGVVFAYFSVAFNILKVFFFEKFFWKKKFFFEIFFARVETRPRPAPKILANARTREVRFSRHGRARPCQNENSARPRAAVRKHPKRGTRPVPCGNLTPWPNRLATL